MIEIFKMLKNRIPILWNIIEYTNGLLIHLFYGSMLDEISRKMINSKHLLKYKCERAKITDTDKLYQYMKRLGEEDIVYFKPFEFDKSSISNVLASGTYQLYLVYETDGNNIIGFFFIRYFINRKCFLGFYVDSEFRSRGIGKAMIRAIADSIHFSCFQLYSTVCEENQASLNAHLSAAPFEIIERLNSNEIVLRLNKHKLK